MNEPSLQVINDSLLQALCYSVAQLEKARIANLLANGITLGADDLLIFEAFGGVDSVSEHVAATELGIEIASVHTPDGVAVESINKAADHLSRAATAEKGVGYYLERLRVKGVAYLLRLREVDPDTVAELIARMAKFFIFIGLDDEMGEGAKP